ncbi:ROK family transcriptional regulator [Streptomyces sp. NPDC006551]|uniref:ROK family transcriptional regulator n=1 Tax=Streptomyces sp. NPDC006551 TaxID=3157178 RepID=UPI0033BED53B
MKKTPATGSARPVEPKADKASVRRHNLSLVLRTVHEAGETTRAAVAARVGLTRAAVSSLVEQLLEHGLLVESGKTFSGQAGRPGTVLKAADTGPAGLGAEINVDYVSVCVVDLAGADRIRITEPLDNRTAGPVEVLERAARIAARALEAAAEQRLHPVGVRLALPGLVSAGTVQQAPNLGWNRVEADRLFAGALAALRPGGPELPVASDNEANAAALAELWFGALGAVRSFLHLTGEIGVGGAIVVNGELLRGAHGFAGEIGHLPVDANGPLCRCGSHGCLEQYAGQSALLRAAGLPGLPTTGAPVSDASADAPVPDASADAPVPDASADAPVSAAAAAASASAVAEARAADASAGAPASASAAADAPASRASSSGDAPASGASAVDELVRRVDAGEPRAVAAVEEAGRMLGLALSGAVNLLDPEAVVLGGIYPRLMARLGPAVDAELGRRVVSGLWTPSAGRLRAASTSADAARGAAAVVIREVLADPLAYTG